MRPDDENTSLTSAMNKSSSYADESIWTSSCSNTKFIHGAASKNVYCRVVYDAETRFLSVVNWVNDSIVFNSFSIDDVVGAEIVVDGLFVPSHDDTSKTTSKKSSPPSANLVVYK